MRVIIPVVIDTAFSVFISFILSLILLSVFLPHPANVVFAVCLAVFLGVVFAKIIIKKKGAFTLSNTQKKLCENTLLQLNFMDKSELLSYFEKVILAYGTMVEKRRNYLYIKESSIALFFKFEFKAVEKFDVLKAYNEKPKNSKVYIFSESFNDEIKAFANRFDNVELIDGQKTFEIVSKVNVLPEEKFPAKAKKTEFFKNFKTLFLRRRAKSHALFGFLFLIMSTISPFKLYYLFSGTAFLILSLISLLFGQTESAKK